VVLINSWFALRSIRFIHSVCLAYHLCLIPSGLTYETHR